MTYEIWLGAVKIEITIALLAQEIELAGKTVIEAADMVDEMEELFNNNFTIAQAVDKVLSVFNLSPNFPPNMTQYEDTFCNIIARAYDEDWCTDEIEAKIFNVIKHEEIKLWYKAKLSAQELAIKIMNRLFTKEEMDLIYFKDEFFGRVSRMMERENNYEFKAEIMKATSESELIKCVAEKIYVKTFAISIVNKLTKKA
jgi:hypothetical protein